MSIRVSVALGALLTMATLSAAVRPIAYDFTRQRLFPGFDGKTCKIAPEIATDGKGVALLSWQNLLLTGSDVFYGQYLTRSTDGGRTWGEPQVQTALADTREGKLRVCHCAHVHYSHRNARWFALGLESLYANDKVPYQKYENGRPFQRPLYVRVDAEKGHFTGYEVLPFPFAYEGAMPFGQIVECDNGEIIVPFYFKRLGKPGDGTVRHRSCCVTVRYAFDGDALRVVKAGVPIEDYTLRRGLGEPSLARLGGKYYLTLRSDERGMFAESDDGLSFGKPKTWCWEDGTPIGNRNTQQHWLVGRDGLFLAYTRERPDNMHVFRNRAPVFMARFDSERGCLVRETEMTLVPELGARLGNFCCVEAGPNEAWLVTAEWMQSWRERLGCERYGSDNSIWLVKLFFGKEAWNVANR